MLSYEKKIYSTMIPSNERNNKHKQDENAIILHKLRPYSFRRSHLTEDMSSGNKPSSNN